MAVFILQYHYVAIPLHCYNYCTVIAMFVSVIGRLDKAMPIMKKTIATKDNLPNMSVTHGSESNTDSKDKSSFTPIINIAIETDDGYLQPPEIDEIEEVFREDEEPKAKTPDCEGKYWEKQTLS